MPNQKSVAQLETQDLNVRYFDNDGWYRFEIEDTRNTVHKDPQNTYSLDSLEARFEASRESII